MSHTYRSFALALASVLLAGAVACGDGGNSSNDPTATAGQPTTNATPAQSTPIATAAGGPNEGGEAPIFWRTADDFQSVVAGQQYKMLLRITNGYAELTIRVVAACTTCLQRSPVSLSGIMVTPVGAETPGSYYPVNVLLPEPGQWELTVQAGADEVTIPVDVQPAS